MKSSFYSEAELKKLGLKAFGKNVLISRKCSLYGADKMTLGHDVRIDDFCILSGHITIGNYVHIAAYSALYAGHAGIEIQDFCGVSARGTIYSAIDDFSGAFMISPMVPPELTNLTCGKVVLKRFTQLGCGTVVFPQSILNEGVATGAFTLVKGEIPAWSLVAGIPAKKIKDRQKGILELAKKIEERE